MAASKPAGVDLVAVFLVAAGLCMPSAWAGDAEWRYHMRSATEALQRGDLRSAHAGFVNALKEAEAFGEYDERTAMPAQNLAYIATGLGRYSDAEVLYARVAKILEKVRGPNDPLLATTLAELAHVYQALGRPREAEPLHRRALRIRESVLDVNHVDIAHSLNSLGQLLEGRAEAEQFLRRALSIYERVHGKDHEYAAIVLANLARSLRLQSRHEDALPLYIRALKVREDRLGKDHPDLGKTLLGLGSSYVALLRYAEAEVLYKRALAAYEKAHGPTHPDVGIAIAELARVSVAQGRLKDSEALFLRALSISEATAGPRHPETGVAMSDLANLYQGLGREEEAASMFRRSLEVLENALGSDHPRLAPPLRGLGAIGQAKGQYAEAESLVRRAIQISEKALGPTHPGIAGDLNLLARILAEQARYSEAIVFARRAMETREKTYGPDHLSVASSANTLAGVLQMTGQYREAEQLFIRSLRIGEKSVGRDHAAYAQSSTGLARTYRLQGKYDDAERIYREAFATFERVLGSEHRTVGIVLADWGAVYALQGRYAEAEVLLRRAVRVVESSSGKDHAYTSQVLANLALALQSQGKTADAEQLYERILSIQEKALGPKHPGLAITLSNAAQLQMSQDRLSEAEVLVKKALLVLESASDSDHPDVGLIQNNLAEIYRRQGRHGDAEVLLKKALKVLEGSLGESHPNVVTAQNNLAAVFRATNRLAEALPIARRATNSTAMRVLARDSAMQQGRFAEHRSRQLIFDNHIGLLGILGTKDLATLAESWHVAQLARANDTGYQVAQMAARYASGDDDLAVVIRKRQDLVEALVALESNLLEAVTRSSVQRDQAGERRLRADTDNTRTAIADLDARIDKEFPRYRELVETKPIPLRDTQGILRANEALVVILVSSEESFVWVTRRDLVEFRRLSVTRAELDGLVRRLRRQLDLSGSNTPERLVAFPFDAGAAFQLYQRLLQPVEEALTGVRHLMLVVDGPLSSLPMSVLLTEAPRAARLPLAELADLPWLTKKLSLSVLPSVGSLRAIRAFSRGRSTGEPFVGFGDPVLQGGESSRGQTVASLYARGGLAQPSDIRKLAKLPETAGELRAIAETLGARPERVLLGPQATETAVKGADLTQMRTIAFATHGLMAGEFKGLAEPALVLTPPEKSTAQDDGLLTASEIAQLKLDADWVILSACNTAAPDGSPGAEGLSGLARAFLYAGARSLLVSHWSVNSEATVSLTTRTLDEVAKGTSKAEALRRSILELMRGSKHPSFAHPAFWAPFVVVGDGQ